MLIHYIFIFICFKSGQTRDGKGERPPVLCPPHAKSWLIGKDSDAGRDWGQEEKGTTEDAMAGWHHWLDGRESEWTLGDGDGQGGLACCDSWGRKESDTTERLNRTEDFFILPFWFFLWSTGYSGVCCLIFIYLWIFQFSSYYWFLFHIMFEKDTWYDFNFLNFLQLILCCDRLFILKSVPSMLEYRIYVLLILYGIFCTCLLVPFGLEFGWSLIFLIDFLSGRSVHCRRWSLKSPIITVLFLFLPSYLLVFA